MNINTSNYFSASASSNKGMSGLVSNMDTESMVKQMLSNTQNKIDKQQALKQQALWKQDIYRDVITSINDFQTKYFNTAYGADSANNFASAAFFNSMTSSVTSGDGVRIISTGSAAAAGDIRVDVKNLATSAKLASNTKMSGAQTITGKALTADGLRDVFDKKIVLKIDGAEVAVNLNHATTEGQIADAFNTALNGTGVTAKVYDGRLRLVTEDDTKTIQVDADNSSKLGLEMSGLNYTYESSAGVIQPDGTTKNGKMLMSGQVHPAAGPSFTIAVDGVQKQITLNDVAGADGTITEDSLLAAVQREVRGAFGDYVQVSMRDGKLQLGMNFKDSTGAVDNVGHQMVVTGMDASSIGITPGASSNINTGTKLSDERLGLSGDRFAFTINGKEFSFTGNDSVGTVMNTVNASGAGVRMSYSALSDTFQLEATSTGSQYKLELSQTQGDFLTKIFDAGTIGAAGSVAGKELGLGELQSATGGLAADYTTTGGSLKMNVNGQNYTFTIQPRADGAAYDKGAVELLFNNWLQTTFGEYNDGGTDKAKIAYENGKLHIAEGMVVKFSQSTVDLENAEKVADAAQTDLALAFGFNYADTSNVADAAAETADLKALEGVALTYNGAGTTLADVTAIEYTDSTGAAKSVAASYENGRLVLHYSGEDSIDFGVDTPLAKLFGSQVALGGAAAATTVANGADAVITINGVDTTRTSNTFTIDGITMEATKAGTGETVIDTKRDVDKIVEGFQAFVKDYNAMLEKLNGYVGEKTNYKSYAPLTSEQKKEMSDREVELWEEKAKQGLVHRDADIDSFLSRMRMALYTKPAGAKLALYDIGIETSKWEDKGKLMLDEAALRNALTSDPDAVLKLFTDSTSGLAKQMTAIMDQTAKLSAANPGTLVQMAGMEGWSSEKNNTITRQITSIEARIKELQTKYEAERSRYWNQFNTMEQILANFNSQSMMISQQFSGTM